ncbi:Diphosphomevalonate decarboxylase [Seminavis robusta]|uniref:Diphosphomevalonate decarboxylase n=1 Tax=Seminavis robusta TaxID=568900 RepID=A0A9N8H9F7_9STRA|nr:Diphosphomevalonate decarboxylase [Seminavis robusta]|eukprot:Sro274_g105360.1 Diphosphomevalonate decarboxylase (427) ;mRNA; r:24758-26038
MADTGNKKQKLVHTSGAPIYMETSSAPTNIATIKYWGKADAKWNTPINDSVSVTLNQDDLKAVTTVAASTAFENDRLWLNGEEEEGAADNKRFRACVDGVRALATEKKDDDGKVLVTKEDWSKMKIHVSSYNTFPTAAGLASSAAGYAALVAALALLFGAKEEFPGQLTSIARQGSGSACRSLSGGFVAWRKGGKKEDWSDSLAEQVADENHWPEIRAVIMVVSDAKKDTSSTAGMSTSVETSLLLKHRADTVVSQRMEAIEKAFLAKDFETFGQLTMADSNQFHATCLDTYPPIFYMNDVSKSIIRIIHVYNKWAGKIQAAYTFDAGPNAVIFTLEEHAVEVGALMLHYYPEFGDKYVNNPDFEKKIKDFKLDKDLLEATDKTGREPKSGEVKMMYYTSSGPGPQRLTDTILNLDPTTGLNTYKK